MHYSFSTGICSLAKNHQNLGCFSNFQNIFTSLQLDFLFIWDSVELSRVQSIISYCCDRSALYSPLQLDLIIWTYAISMPIVMRHSLENADLAHEINDPIASFSFHGAIALV